MYAPWGLLVLVYPAVVLHARRLHDMGRTGWLLLVPAVLTVAAMAIWARRISLGAQLDFTVPLAAFRTMCFRFSRVEHSDFSDQRS